MELKIQVEIKRACRSYLIGSLSGDMPYAICRDNTTQPSDFETVDLCAAHGQMVLINLGGLRRVMEPEH